MGSVFAQNFIRGRSFRDITVGKLTLGYAFDLFLPDPRGSHLSCIENFTVLEDGAPVDPRKLIFRINGKEFPVSHFGELGYEFWRIDEDAELRVMNGKACEEVDRLTVRFGMRVPYAGDSAHPVVAPLCAEARPNGKEQADE